MVHRSDVKIDDLPKRKDDERVELKDQPDCSHFFEMKKANEVECNKCHLGFFLSPDNVLEGGHIYKKELII